MYSVSDIKGLKGIVGWREPTISAYQSILDTDNKASSSGLYVNDEFPLCSIPNIYDTVQDNSISNVNFNTLLDRWQEGAIIKVANDIFNDEEDLLENQVLYNYENRYSDTIDNGTKFVGFEIDIYKNKEIGLYINSILAHFDSAKTFTLYWFHSSKIDPITSTSIAATENNVVETAVSDFVARYSDYKGGKYYVGYLQSALGSTKAIKKDYELSNVKRNYRYATIRPIEVSGWDSATLFDVDDIEYTDESWGLNLDVSINKDYTDVIVRNKNMFAQAISLGVAAKALEQISHTSRINNNQMLAGQALVELKGNEATESMPYNLGVERRLKREIERLKKNFRGKSRIHNLTLTI